MRKIFFLLPTAYFLLVTACSFYDNYDIALMDAETASIESSAGMALSSSSGPSTPRNDVEESSSSAESASSSSVTLNEVDGSSSSEWIASSSSTPRNDVDESSSSEVPASSAEESSSSAVTHAFKCGEKFKDSRDGKEYATVAIPNKSGQCWFAENLNYASDKSSCYGDNDENCATYGRLYLWREAQSVCPEGSFLPTQDEWKNLYFGNSFSAGFYLKEKDVWGDDVETSYGFSALPAGYYSEDDDEFVMIKEKTVFWSATESGTDAEAFYLTKGENSFVNAEYSKADMLSVRCLVENFK